MQSGYLLRDVLDKVNDIHFSSSEEIHTLGHLYESMLKEMRDAAGDSGEFYTPRPFVEMIVRTIDPQPGETVLDPAAGTGGFLVEAYEHLKPRCATVEQLQWLQGEALHGIEAKSLPYLLCQMNLLLHGVETPDIDSGNALRFRMSEIGDRDRVDIIMTNPPFGGEEEKGIQNSFPEDKQTAETALLFLQFIMRKLRRPGHDGRSAGRAGVVVPNGTLFGEGVATRIKQELLENYNLHTIVRLPSGVFSPYTSIPTNVLFFDRSGPTLHTWYFEHVVPGGRKSYIKTQPLRFEDFKPLLHWWNDRQETDRAWCVRVDQFVANHYNLDLKNPRSLAASTEWDPANVADSVARDQSRAAELAGEIRRDVLAHRAAHSDFPDYPRVSLGDLLMPISRPEPVDPGRTYEILGARWYAKGLYTKGVKTGQEIRAKTVYRVEAGDFVYNRLFAWQGSFALADEANDSCYVSNEFLCYRVDEQRLDSKFLWYYFSRQAAWNEALGLSSGSTPTSRNRLKEERFLAMTLPLPHLREQREVVALVDKIQQLQAVQGRVAEASQRMLESALERGMSGAL